MKPNLIVLNNTSIIETKLIRMQELTKQIDILEAEKKMLKEEVIKEYFDDHESYQTAKGMVLATYKGYEIERFQTKDFEIDNPEVYLNYVKKKMEFRFTLKK